jgi:membrane protease YdiL (CAAX protease family)
VHRGTELGIVGGYAAAGAVAAGLSVVLGRDPIATASWVGLVGTESVIWSVILGVVLAGVTVLSSRILARKTTWARALHAALRPAIRDLDGTTIAWMALASGVGEELFFRGLLVPTLGVGLSSLAFGVVHQVRGPARWVWAGWALAMGVLFARVFAITGSLVGAVVAHVTINAANLRFIRDVDPEGLNASSTDPKLAEWVRRSTSRTPLPASAPPTRRPTMRRASTESAGASAPPRGSRSSA